MKSIYLISLFIAIVGYKPTIAQLDNELALTDENDNQFPFDNPSEPSLDNVEGSGEIPAEIENTATTTEAIELEEIEPATTKAPDDKPSCPELCTCNIETDGLSVECADKGLENWPSDIDVTTTSLNLENNKLTKIPQSISTLKNLKVLNVNSNLIRYVSFGSISELQELKVLNIANNKLVDYPQDIKNAFFLIKLEELDLSGNEMATTFAVENFSIFKSLHKLILPKTGIDLSELLCEVLKESLKQVCVESCSTQSLICVNVLNNDDKGKFSAKLPGSIALDNSIVGNTGILEDNYDLNEDTSPGPIEETADKNGVKENISKEDEFSLRSMVNKQVELESALNNIVDVPTETDIKVGAATTETKTGSVDKTLIAGIVAGMILIVAGITIKKNWSSMKQRFSSNPRPANGTVSLQAQEEMPLQDSKDKSPV